jgi:DNA-binding NarL/FixJ family response regulator
MYREALESAIRQWPEFELVKAIDGRDLLSVLLTVRPDVALVDPTMLSVDDREELFATTRDGMRVVCISAASDDGGYEALERGVMGCLTKDADAREICDAIAAAARGEGSLARTSVGAIVNEIRFRNQVDRPHLSKREREVLQRIADGQSGPQVGRQLQIEQSTVKTHLRNIYTKLGARGRAHAVMLAMRFGLID